MLQKGAALIIAGELFLNVLLAAGILFLTASGLFIVFRLMGIVNLAHGEFIMLGAYTAYFVGYFNMSPWISCIAAPIITAIVGLFIERLLMRRLYGKIMESILATWGLSMLLQQLVITAFGSMPRYVSSPVNQAVSAFGITYPLYEVLIIAFAVVLLVTLLWLDRKTQLGAVVRAVIESPETAAAATGINVNRVYQLSFVVGSMLAGFAGAVIAPIVTVTPVMGLDYVIRAFLAVLVGGAAAIPSVALGASVLGGSESIASFLWNPVIGYVVVILISVTLMRLRQSQAR